MTKSIKNITTGFEQVITLITEARHRVYSKANAELVMLYFNVGKIVSDKVANGNWGDGTVDDLANFIATKQPFLKGFNRRGLYRMKQFYEVYSDKEIVSTMLTQLTKNTAENKVSPAVTQIEIEATDEKHTQTDASLEDSILSFCKNILSKISWTNHLLILSKTKGIEEKLFYLNQCTQDNLSKRELERQLNSATFERTMLGSKIASFYPRFVSSRNGNLTVRSGTKL